MRVLPEPVASESRTRTRRLPARSRIIAALGVASLQKFQIQRLGGKLATREITRDEFVRARKFRNRLCFASLAGGLVVFHELVAVGTENKRDVVQFADAVILALLQTVFGR